MQHTDDQHVVDLDPIDDKMCGVAVNAYRRFEDRPLDPETRDRANQFEASGEPRMTGLSLSDAELRGTPELDVDQVFIGLPGLADAHPSLPWRELPARRPPWTGR